MSPFVRALTTLLAPFSGGELGRKKSATAYLMALQTQGQPVWTPRDFGALAREGFARNPVVYRAVRMIAECAASVQWDLFEGTDRLSDHPLLTLMARPNPAECGPDFFEACYGYLIVAGNSYVEAVSLGGDVRELHALRPDRMKVVPGVDGWAEAYDYTANGQSVRFHQDATEGVRPILHVKFFHPTNDHYGMSPIEAAALGTDIHNAASAWNKALLDNSARPSGALVYSSKDEHLSAEQFERLKAELETNYQGAVNAGRPLLLEGGLDWKAMALSPRDMDFIEAKSAAARDIALALGVPPMLLGLPGDNTYSNLQEANRIFWRQTVIPLVRRFGKAFSAWLGPAFGEGLELRPNLDQVEALSSEREALWERVRKSDFLTLNEKRAAVGLGPVDEGDDIHPGNGQ